MRKNEAEMFDRCLKSQQKWQMAAFLLLDELNRRGIDMRWVMDADKHEIVTEMLWRRKVDVFTGSFEMWKEGDGI